MEWRDNEGVRVWGRIERIEGGGLGEARVLGAIIFRRWN